MPEEQMPDAMLSRCRIGQLPVSIAQSVPLLSQRATGTSTVRSCGDLRASFSPRLTPSPTQSRGGAWASAHPDRPERTPTSAGSGES